MRAFAVFSALLLGFIPAASSQAVSEASVKAAYLYRFADYIDWSDQSFTTPDAPFVIGVMNADEIEAAIVQLTAGRRVGAHPIVPRVVRPGEPLQGVNMLFVGREAPERVRATVAAAEKQGAIVVTEGEGGLESGSSINFVVAGNRVGFEVSTVAAERSGHHISARMLAVARRVVKGT